jgi:hypothetical protein
MQLANTMMMSKHKLLGLVLLALPFACLAQENSPYSRYGIGNLVPQGNILNRGIGGISASFSDISTINFINPASYADLKRITLDIAIQVDSRTLVQQSPVDKFTSNNATVPYLQLGIPLLANSKKAALKKISWAATFGLRPVSRINYKIENLSRLPGIDSLSTVYEGNGGVNEAFIGTGVRIKKIAFGVNVGYLFGNKNYATRLEFINDTVNYLKSNSANNTNFGGVFINAGILFTDTLKNKTVIKVGAYGNLSQNYKATQDIIRETFVYNSAGGQTSLDSVYKQTVNGKIKLPATVGIGFSIDNGHVLTGLDFETTSWSNYSFLGQKDFIKNSWSLKAGFQYYPVTLSSKRYRDFVKYRFGLYYGSDYINIDKNMPEYGVTAGLGLPLKLRRNFYETQYSVLNLAIEYGSRGNKNNNIKENIFRVGLGFTFSDLWFRRYKYD